MSMLSNTVIETRLKAILEVPGNEVCSECQKPDQEVKYASFFKSPVDQRLLGVLCCRKCRILHDEVGEGEFYTKSLTELDDCEYSISVLLHHLNYIVLKHLISRNFANGIKNIFGIFRGRRRFGCVGTQW